MDKTEALARAVEALRAADRRDLAEALDTVTDAYGVRRIIAAVVTQGTNAADDGDAVIDALCALRLVLRGYTVQEPGHGPPP